MTKTEQDKLFAALTKAFIEAINKVGLKVFKSTTMFGSSGR